jgi:hypothetical protein
MPTVEEIQDNFYIKYGNKLMDLLSEIKEDCNANAINILDKPKQDYISEFVDLILLNIDTKNIN